MTVLPLRGLINLKEGEFDRRRKQARRNGNPAWLWQEVPVAQWHNVMTDLAAATSAILNSGEAHLGDCDPLALSLACYTSGMGPLLGWWLERNLLTGSRSVAAVLAVHLRHAKLRSERVSAKSKEIVSSLAKKSIPLIVLKGGHTASRYFPDRATRPAADLDLLVPMGNELDAKIELARAGFRCIGASSRESSWGPTDGRREPRSIWLAHARDPWSVDLHKSLDFAATPGAKLTRLDRADPFATNDRWALDGAAGALRQPLQLLHLAVHASGGLHSLTLLRMIELILVIRRDSDEGNLSWDEFVRLGELTNGLGSAYPALAICEKLAPKTTPQHILRHCRDRAAKRVVTIVDALEPAHAQRLDRASIAEHFMWVSGIDGWSRQLGSDFLPWRSFRTIYEARAYRLLRRTITR